MSLRGGNARAFLQVPVVVLANEDNDTDLYLAFLRLEGVAEGRVLLEQVRLASATRWMHTWRNPFEVIDTEDGETNAVRFVKEWRRDHDGIHQANEALAAWLQVRFLGQGKFLLKQVGVTWDEHQPNGGLPYLGAKFWVGEHSYQAA